MSDETEDDSKPEELLDHLRNFAHEIRTPLTAMIGYSQLIGRELEENKDLDKIADYNGIVEESTVRLLRICERVLDDAITGVQTVKPEPIDISALAKNVLATFEEMARQRGIVLNAEFDDDFPQVESDRIMVEQVLSNLVSNAIKYSARGGTVTIKGELDHDEQAMIFLIRDTGDGIPAHILMKLRNGEPIQTASNGKHQSWGRGLNIARAICERLGAELVFQPADGGGTVVLFRLPIST